MPSTPLRIAELRPSPDTGLIGITFAPGKKGQSLYGGYHDRNLDDDLDVVAAVVVTLIEGLEFLVMEIWEPEKEVRHRSMEWQICR